MSALNAQTWVDQKTGKEKRVYRDLAPGTVAVLGQWFATYLGEAGLFFAKRERRDEERKTQELAEFRQALGNMH